MSVSMKEAVLQGGLDIYRNQVVACRATKNYKEVQPYGDIYRHGCSLQ